MGSGGAAADIVAGDLGVIGDVDGSASWSGIVLLTACAWPLITADGDKGSMVPCHRGCAGDNGSVTVSTLLQLSLGIKKIGI